MNVLLIGGGGREHAVAWKLRQSPRLTDLHVAPGNAGTAVIANNLDLPIPKTAAPRAEVEAYLDAVVTKARELRVDLVVVAPDDPLAWGLIDRLQAAGIPAFGPTRAAAEIESSKAWAKEFMARHAIPHTRTRTFNDVEAAREYVRSAGTRLVVKADGLAAGKGSIVTSSREEALATVDQLMAERVFGEAGSRVVIEEWTTGREVSGHAFSDGQTAVPMPLSCDHKPVFDGNQGPNTGGMGVYSPPWWSTPEIERAVFEQVIRPAADGLRAEGRPFCGVIYPGLFVTEGGLSVFEFNARLGDPEAQALLPRLKSDLLDIVWACVNGRLREVAVEWSEDACVCVVLASGGYPGEYRTGLPIGGLEAVDADVQVFHAGTRRREDGSIVTAGGRVLNVVATGPTLAEARAKAYANVERIRFEGMHYRRDIGLQPE